MTIDEIQNALKFNMDMVLFDPYTGETRTKETLKYGNEMNYIHYCAEEQAIELLDELKELRKMREDIESNANAIKNYGYNKVKQNINRVFGIPEQLEKTAEKICDEFCIYRCTCDENAECNYIRCGNTCPLDALVK